jgi:hypothetical protein
MPAFIAAATGIAKLVSAGLLLMTVVAMPFALAATAVSMALSICETVELVDPVHFGADSPSSAAASLIPNWVGTKNGFVVT